MSNLETLVEFTSGLFTELDATDLAKTDLSKVTESLLDTVTPIAIKRILKKTKWKPSTLESRPRIRFIEKAQSTLYLEAHNRTNQNVASVISVYGSDWTSSFILEPDSTKTIRLPEGDLALFGLFVRDDIEMEEPAHWKDTISPETASTKIFSHGISINAERLIELPSRLNLETSDERFIYEYILSTDPGVEGTRITIANKLLRPTKEISLRMSIPTHGYIFVKKKEVESYKKRIQEENRRIKGTIPSRGYKSILDMDPGLLNLPPQIEIPDVNSMWESLPDQDGKISEEFKAMSPESENWIDFNGWIVKQPSQSKLDVRIIMDGQDYYFLI